MSRFHLTTIPLAEPVTVYLPRRRIRGVGGETTTAETGEPLDLDALELAIHPNPVTRHIYAQIARIPTALLLYGPADWSVAAADTPAQHGARALQILGSDIASALQALIDQRPLPDLPARVPREIANWRARAVLDMAGLLPTVETIIAGMEGMEGVIVRHAWASGAPLLRGGPTVLALAPALGLAEDRVDQMFVAGAGLEV